MHMILPLTKDVHKGWPCNFNTSKELRAKFLIQAATRCSCSAPGETSTSLGWTLRFPVTRFKRAWQHRMFILYKAVQWFASVLWCWEGAWVGLFIMMGIKDDLSIKLIQQYNQQCIHFLYIFHTTNNKVTCMNRQDACTQANCDNPRHTVL